MRTVASKLWSRVRRVRVDSRPVAPRKARLRNLLLEFLEPRSLLAVLPAIPPTLAVNSDTGASNSDGDTWTNTPTFTGRARVNQDVSATSPTTLKGGALVRLFVRDSTDPASPSMLGGE